MITAFIPARAGSKSIPNKNVKELGGKPLIAWSIEKAFAAGIQRVVVSTDGEEIAKIARQYGAEVLMRPQELAKDETPMFDVLKSEVPKITPIPEIVVLLQPTSPFRELVHVKTAISLLSNNLDQYDCLISAERVPEKWHPNQVIVNTPTGHKMANGAPISQRKTRRQDFEEAWVPTGSIYAFKTSNLEKGSLYGDKTLILETDGTVNINSPEDFAAAERIWADKNRPIISASRVMHIAEDGICESCE